MGNYLNYSRKDKSLKALKKELRAVYNLHKKKDKKQFLNDFGQVNKFNEVILVYNDGSPIDNKDRVQIKIGVLDREFYSKEFLKDVNDILIDFGFL